ncbi:caspase-9 isoform 2-T2 [Lycodopsis pacificus]
MEEVHKKILQRNRTNLVRDLHPSNLYDGLLEKGVFTQDMIDEIKSAGTRRDQARKLVQDLETRGSRAFPLFLVCLEQTDQQSLAELLQCGAPAVQLQPATPNQVDLPVVRPLPLSLPTDVDQQRKDVVPVHPSQRPSLTPSPSPERESMRTRPPGRIRRDSIQQIKHALSALSQKDHSQYDCCVVIMLSHGTEVSHSRFPGAVYGVDGQHVPVQLITNYLNGRHCLSLQGKPKLFFIQACGGGERDTGFEVSPDEVEPSIGGADDQTDAIPMSSSSDSLSTSDELDARATLPTPSDILVSYSTFPGYVSWRDPQAGSWYVEILNSILEENAATDDLATMLMMVNHEVSQNSAKGLYKQMPGSFNFLRKLLHFQTQA